MMKNKSFSLYAAFAFLLIIFYSCKKNNDIPIIDREPVILLKSILREGTPLQANFFYDDNNHLLYLSDNNSDFHITKYDSRFNILEIRDTGYFSGLPPLITKHSFQYDTQNRITRIDSYSLTDVYFSDTTKPKSYTTFQYYTDSTIKQEFFIDADGTYYTGQRYLIKVYTDTAGNVTRKLQADDETLSGYPEFSNIYTSKFNTLKNPFRLLPQAVLEVTPVTNLFSAYSEVATYSADVWEQLHQDYQYYDDSKLSPVLIEQDASNSVVKSLYGKGYPEKITQTFQNKITVVNTGETTEDFPDAEVFDFEFYRR